MMSRICSFSWKYVNKKTQTGRCHHAILEIRTLFAVLQSVWPAGMYRGRRQTGAKTGTETGYILYSQRDTEKRDFIFA
jgi:hypothetical protein